MPPGPRKGPGPQEWSCGSPGPWSGARSILAEPGKAQGLGKVAGGYGAVPTLPWICWYRALVLVCQCQTHPCAHEETYTGAERWGQPGGIASLRIICRNFADQQKENNKQLTVFNTASVTIPATPALSTLIVFLW